MTKTILIATFLLLFTLAASGQSSEDRAKAEILAVINAQAEAWNRGDIDGFMSGYWNSPEMTFVSGDSVTRGWQQTLDRYKAGYNTREKMGVLSFTELEVRMLSKKSAVVLGRFTLVRAADRPTGLFTLSFKKFKNGWKIVLDHTS